jgi:hypothetical protein
LVAWLILGCTKIQAIIYRELTRGNQLLMLVLGPVNPERHRHLRHLQPDKVFCAHT